MKKSIIMILTLCYVSFGITLQVSAEVKTFIGTFNATFNNPTEGIPNITGSWSFDFDTESIPGTGFGTIVVNLKSLTLSPSLVGATSFNISNASGWLQYHDGILIRVGIGGDISGPANMSSDTDDFGASYDETGYTLGVSVSVASSPLSIDSAPGLQGGSVSGSYTIYTPESFPWELFLPTLLHRGNQD